MNELSFCKAYNSGNFSKCIQLLRDNAWRNSISNKDKIKITEESVLKYLEDNNVLVCETLGNSVKEEDVLNNFISLYSNHKSLTATPIELDLTVIHNLLWWFTFKIKPTTNIDFHFKGVLRNLLQCLVKVIKLYSSTTVLELHCMNSFEEFNLVNVLEHNFRLLLQIPPVVTLQLISVITLALLLSIRKQLSFSEEFYMTVKTTIDQVDLMEMHMNQFQSSHQETIFFKFGFSQTNSTASMGNKRTIVEAFVISGSLLCLKQRKFSLALDCLQNILQTEVKEFKCLANIVKAYCLLHCERYVEAKLSLAHANTVPLSPTHQAYYCLLLGQVFSAQDQHQAALTQFQTVLESCTLPLVSSIAAYHAAMQAQHLHLPTLQLNFLKQLVQILQEHSEKKDNGFEGFEDVCLHLVFNQNQVLLADALYTLSRQYYITGYHINAVNGYKQLLEVLKSDEDSGDSNMLPPKMQILHEVVLSHIKADRLSEGEALCRQLMRDHVPQTQSRGKWEAMLYQMDEDVVACILLSDILLASDKRKALDQLNRCYNMVIEVRQERGEDSVQTMLCDWLLSRILLRKAQIRQGDDAVHDFRRAFMHVPGDKEVMYHYKQWSLWHPDHQAFDPGDQVTAFPETEIIDLALRHILTCSISTEEWNALFDHDTSQNVLDTLFEDD